MKNREYVLQNHADELLAVIPEYGICEMCKAIGCNGYCRSGKAPRSCKETFESWLNMEHTDALLYPIGTIVEVSYSGERDLQYYNGIYKGKHYCTHFFNHIGKTYSNGRPDGIIYNRDSIRKVGDANA